MTEHRGFRVDGAWPVATFVLDRPDQGNRLTNPMIAELGRGLSTAASNREVALIVLKGAGSDFCLGRDPRGDAREGLSAYEARTKIHDVILNAYQALRTARVPTVAVVSGRAYGFGAALASACDVVIASEEASFALPEIELGFAPTLAMSALLGKIPDKSLAFIALDGQPFSSARALELGVVSVVLPKNEFEARAIEYIDRMARRPLPALETLKLFMREGKGLGPATLATFASSLLSLAHTAK